MYKEKHPIHLVAKKSGQLNKVMLAIMKEERPSHGVRGLISPKKACVNPVEVIVHRDKGAAGRLDAEGFA